MGRTWKEPIRIGNRHIGWSREVSRFCIDIDYIEIYIIRRITYEENKDNYIWNREIWKAVY